MKKYKPQIFFPSFNKLRFLIIFSFFSITLTSFAATVTWNGSVDSNWENSSNWDGNKVPRTRDNVIIAVSGNYPIIVAGQSISIRGVTVDSGAYLTVEGGELYVSRNLTNSGNVYLNSGIVNFDRRVNNYSGATFTTNGATVTISGIVTNEGTIDFTSGSVVLENRTRNLTSGTINITGADISARNDIINNGNITISSGSLSLERQDGTPKNLLKIDGGTFSQSGGSVSTKDLTVTNNGTFTQTSGDLTVSNTLQVNGSIFNQSNGTVSVKDINVRNGGTYTQNSGTLEINNDFIVSSGNTFNSTNGLVNFTGSAGNSSNYKGDIQFNDIVIDDGVNPRFDNNNNVNINISGNYTNNNPNLRVTKATFTFNGTNDQTIFTASTYGKSTFGNLVIDKSSGSATMLTDLEVEDTFTELNGTLDLNGYTLIVAGIPVPVELTSFTAKKFKNGVMLNWSTATEVNNYGFSVERKSSFASQNKSGDSFYKWETLGFIEGHGNSNSPKDYSFYDNSPPKGKALYRLKQIDTDGAFEYSDEIELTLQSDKIELYQNYPNPFNPSTVVSFTLPEMSHVKLTVYNAIGQEVAELVNRKMSAGYHGIIFDAYYLSTGLYFYKLETKNYSKIMKMVLLR